MKNFCFAFILLILGFSCQKEPTVTQKIAKAHGFENWDKVTNMSFTFGEKRSWKWSVKTNDIILTTKEDTISYNQTLVDSTSLTADRAFINDKFWLLIPFQLVWDKTASISQMVKETSPINKTIMNKITITYPNNGGYTPGDAYDIFFDDDYIIREWIFRRGNTKEPSLINTFENYQNFNGIKIALNHKTLDGKQVAQLKNITINLK
ncbi:hypothetical protein [Seonamhaeicola sp.]|uniref:hypothetical protein n=1 Tax=Seonamhaeicola sp. TaxID=1912245 RepID=UPI00356570C6